MNLQSLYQELILDHHKNPHCSGLRDPYDTEVHHHNPTCGDDIVLRVLVDDAGIVQDISYNAQGCSISVASTSMMTDLLIGEPVDVAYARYKDMTTMMETRDGTEPDEEILGDAVALAGVSKFPARVKCAMLGWAAVKDALLQTTAQEKTR